jgi:hypothetical protein
MARTPAPQRRLAETIADAGWCKMRMQTSSNCNLEGGTRAAVFATVMIVSGKYPVPTLQPAERAT